MDQLTRDLQDSIAYERSKRLQPFNPTLSEFSKDQLQTGLKAFLVLQSQLREHVESLRVYSAVSYMMRDKIIEHETEIEMLSDMIVQYLGAIKNKEREEQENN